MIKDNTSSNKIKENKYKILRMSLLLGNGEDREETINNFEDAAREIDSMNDEIYLKDLEKKFYDTLTLEEEEKKLAVLVDYIGGRVEQRLSLLSDFSNVTGFELTNLPPIKYYDKLDEYKERLSYIREYLENTTNINTLNKEISDLENKLNDAYVSKATAEEQNTKDEQELLNKFTNIIKTIPEFKDIDLQNVDSKLNDIIAQVEDSKKSLDIFDKSFATLNKAGISEEEEQEYLSYVNSAKDIYYNNKEQEYLLRLYILFNNFESDYSKLVFKRDSINDLIYDRMELRKNIKIKTSDKLNNIYDLLEKQYSNIQKQKENIENIEKYTEEINTRQEKVSNLEADNQKVEILSLLKEFCIIDTYEGMENNSTELPIDNIIPNISPNINTDILSDIDSLNVNNINDKNNDIPEIKHPPIEEIRQEFPETTSRTSSEKTEESNIVDIKEAKANQIVSIRDAKNINLEEATLKSNNVMKRVGEMLGVKVETTKIVNVEEKKKPEVKSEIKDTNSQVTFSQEQYQPKEEQKDYPIETFANNSENNIFTNTTFDADPEITNNFNSQTPNIPKENPLFNNNLTNSTIDDVMAQNNIEVNSKNNDDFWYTNEDSPLDLNSLPDINNSNDTFFNTNNNNMPELDFPDLDMNFDSDKEVQQ